MVAVGTICLLDLAARHTTTERASYDGVRVLEVADDGDVRLTGAPAGSPVRVVMRVTEGLRTPGARGRARRRRHAAALLLVPALFAGQCGVDYDVSVPPGVAVRADSSAGDVVAEDLVERPSRSCSSPRRAT